MSVIFSVIGTPTDEDLEFITDEKAIDYIKSFPKMNPVDFNILLPAATDDAIDFLKKTLQFDPAKRMTMD